MGYAGFLPYRPNIYFLSPCNLHGLLDHHPTDVAMVNNYFLASTLDWPIVELLEKDRMANANAVI